MTLNQKGSMNQKKITPFLSMAHAQCKSCTRWEVQKLGLLDGVWSLGFVSIWHKPVLQVQGEQKQQKKKTKKT